MNVRQTLEIITCIGAVIVFFGIMYLGIVARTWEYHQCIASNHTVNYCLQEYTFHK